jgi:hypothetical protein
MSGRLVILPHKSWNVWNRDNREKVLRDERLHKEDENKKLDDVKRLQQEKNLEMLTSNISNNQNKEESDFKPFRLFEDIEKKNALKLCNPGNIKENKKKESALNPGTADWALGDGSIEKSKIKPWFENIDIKKACNNDDMEANFLQKNKYHDPMKKFMKHSSKIKDENINNIVKNESKVEMNDRSIYNYEVKKEKNDIDNKKHQIAIGKSIVKTDKTAQYDDGNKNSRKLSNDNELSRKKLKIENYIVDEQETPTITNEISTNNDNLQLNKLNQIQKDSKINNVNSFSITELRKKRIEREKKEKKKADLLLARVDIYGNSVSSYESFNTKSNNDGYNQRFNPHLSRI